MIDGKIYNFYRLWMNVFGYECQISRFIKNLDLGGKEAKSMLDAGCGTGVIGLQLLKKFPKSKLLATDIQERFLQMTLKNSKRKGISRDRISVGLSDISSPTKVKILNGASRSLKKESFDIVSVGAAIGYSDNPKKTLKELLKLVKPGGYLLDIEMNEKLTGKWVASRYQYNNIPLDDIIKFAEDQGHEASFIPFSAKYFPVNLTRIGILVVKTKAKAGLLV